VPFDGDTEAKTADGDLFSVFALLDDVRFAQREGFTRVVFDFEGEVVPWWDIRYEAGPFVGVPGDLVPVEGDSFLSILMSTSGFDLSTAEVRVVYEGPERIPVHSLSVTEIVRVEDFEAVSQWVIGIDSEPRPFQVGTLLDSPRLYVDISD
jgi:hypothetical protein